MAPVIRETLQPGAFSGRQPADAVADLLLHRRDAGRVLEVPRHERGRYILLHLHIRAGGHGIHAIVRRIRSRCADCMAVGGIQREADTLVDTVPLRAVLLASPDHVPLQNEGLHLVAPGRHERTGFAVQVDELITLIDVEGSRLGLCHIGLLLRPRLRSQCPCLITEVTNLVALVLGERHRLADGNAPLCAGRVTTVAVQRPGGFCFIETAVRIIRQHGMAGLGADAIGFGLQVSFGFRHEQGLVVVTSQRSGFVLLPDGSLPAALTSRADFQRDRCVGFCGVLRALRFHEKRNVAAPGAHPRRKRLYHAVLCDLHPAIGRVVFQRNGSRHHTSPQGWRPLLLVPDAPGIGGVFRAEASRFHDTWRMAVLLRTECPGHILGHIHAGAALVVQDDFSCASDISAAAACRSSAAFSTGGSSLPRTEARRRIPRHALGLK